jgi:hypothetical protein
MSCIRKNEVKIAVFFINQLIKILRAAVSRLLSLIHSIVWFDNVVQFGLFYFGHPLPPYSCFSASTRNASPPMP